jgi:hypothetical protein
MKLKITIMVLMVLFVNVVSAAPDDNIPEWEISSIDAPSAMAIDSSGTLFVLNEYGDLYKIIDGVIEYSVSGISSYDCDNTNLFLSPDDSQIYFYDNMFVLYAYSTETLTEAWTYDVMYDNGIFSSSYGNLIVDKFGYVYVELSMSGSTVILKLDDEGHLIDLSDGNEALTGAPGAITANGASICYPEGDNMGIAHYDTSDLSYDSVNSEFPAISCFNDIIPISLFDGENAMSDTIGALQSGWSSAYGQAQAMQLDSSGNLIVMDYDETDTYHVIRSYSNYDTSPTENWVYSMEDLYPSVSFESGFFLGSDNRLYMMPDGASGATGLFCLNLDTGTLEWSYTVDDVVSTEQANNGVCIGDGFVVIAYDGGIKCFDVSSQPLYCRTGAYNNEYSLNAVFSQYQDGNYGHSLDFYYVTPDGTGSVVVQDNDGTGGFCADKGFITLTGNVGDDGDYIITVQGNIEEGCEITLMAENYDYYEEVSLYFDSALIEDLGYVTTIEDSEYEEFIADDGDYFLTLDSFDEATTIVLEAVVGSSGGSSSSSTETGDDSSSDSGDSSTDNIIGVEISEELTEIIESTNDLPTTTTTTVTTIISNPVNWLVILGAYLGSFLVIGFLREESDPASAILFGTIGWMIPLIVLMLGINPFMLNYFIQSGSVLLGIIEFVILGGAMSLFSFTEDTYNGKKIESGK